MAIKTLSTCLWTIDKRGHLKSKLIKLSRKWQLLILSNSLVEESSIIGMNTSKIRECLRVNLFVFKISEQTMGTSSVIFLMKGCVSNLYWFFFESSRLFGSSWLKEDRQKYLINTMQSPTTDRDIPELLIKIFKMRSTCSLEVITSSIFFPSVMR